MSWLMLLCVGLLAGLVNTIAGGGSLITLPALMAFGLSPTEANGSNRIGILVQSVVATWQMQRDGKVPHAVVKGVLSPVLVGAAIGVVGALWISDDWMRRVVGGLMLLMVPVIVARPKRWLADAEADTAFDPKLGPRGWMVWTSVGLYAGFIQAGVGVFLLAAMVRMAGQDLVRGNGAKVATVAVLTVPALGVFIAGGLVVWAPGLVLAAGASVGAWMGAKMTVSWGPQFVRWVLVLVVLSSGFHLLLW